FRSIDKGWKVVTMQILSLRLYQMCEWIMRVAYINLLWIGFSILGLGVLGVIPSTVAMLGVIRKSLMAENDIPILKTFWDRYKTEFLRSNLLGYIFLIAGVIFYVDFKFIKMQESDISCYLICAILPLFFFLLVALLYIYQMFVHFNMKIKDYMKWSFVLGVKSPLLTFSMLVLVSALLYVMLFEIPALFIFFGGSTIGFVIMWGSRQAFAKHELKELMANRAPAKVK